MASGADPHRMHRQKSGESVPEQSKAQVVLVRALNELRNKAGLSDNGRIVRHGLQQSPPVLFKPQTLSDWFTGRSVPSDRRKFQVLVAFLQAEAEKNSGRKPTRPEPWEELRLRARQERQLQRRDIGQAAPDRELPGGSLLRRTAARASRVPLLDEVECAMYIQEELSRSPNGGNWVVQAVTYVDVDGLLAINAVYGDATGDRVLDTCAELVRGYFQDRGGAVCRLRGDQFVVAQASAQERDVFPNAIEVARLIRRFDWRTISPDLFVSVAVSAAIRARADYGFSPFHEDVPSLILRAILGVKEAKRRGADVAYAPKCVPLLSGTAKQRWDSRIGQIRMHVSD